MRNPNKYLIEDYQKGYEKEQARIGREVAKDWVWPYTYDLEDLIEIHAHPDFDPDTRHYCFLVMKWLVICFLSSHHRKMMIPSQPLWIFPVRYQGMSRLPNY